MGGKQDIHQFRQVSLKSLNLRAGTLLQAQRIEKNSPDYQAQFLGLIEGKCLMLAPVGTFSIKTGMKAGQPFIIRGFTGIFDFYFTSTVVQAFDFTFREPAYAYAVLTFPESVEARRVRTSIRLKTSLAAMLTAPGGQAPLPVTIVDLSADGSLVRSPAPLGAVGDPVRLEFALGNDGEPSRLHASARLCHVQRVDDGYLGGMLFEEISTPHQLLVREFVLAGLE